MAKPDKKIHYYKKSTIINKYSLANSIVSVSIFSMNP